MTNLITRSLSGAVFVILVIGSILIHPLAFAGVFFIITLLGLWEFFNLFSGGKYSPNRWLGIISGGIIYLLFCLVHPSLNSLLIKNDNLFSIFGFLSLFFDAVIFLIISGFLFILAEIFRKKETPFENAAITLLGLFYVVMPMGLMNFLYYTGPANEATTHLLTGIFLLVWTNDTFAYLSGISLGKHLLCPRLSPKKTWEGSIGGAIFAMLAAWILSMFFKEVGPLMWLIIGFIAIIFGTLGDLSESMLKRSLNIKDSGNIMPGHGGILDRFDAILMAVPFVFLALYIYTL
jgi:phosphatidate cytidylyltransferase